MNGTVDKSSNPATAVGCLVHAHVCSVRRGVTGYWLTAWLMHVCLPPPELTVVVACQTGVYLLKCKWLKRETASIIILWPFDLGPLSWLSATLDFPYPFTPPWRPWSQSSADWMALVWILYLSWFIFPCRWFTIFSLHLNMLDGMKAIGSTPMNPTMNCLTHSHQRHDRTCDADCYRNTHYCVILVCFCILVKSGRVTWPYTV